jgi:hypothetical protein
MHWLEVAGINEGFVSRAVTRHDSVGGESFGGACGRCLQKSQRPQLEG